MLNLGLWSLWFLTDTEDTEARPEDTTCGDEDRRPGRASQARDFQAGKELL